MGTRAQQVLQVGLTNEEIVQRSLEDANGFGLGATHAHSITYQLNVIRVEQSGLLFGD
jgi:hypothetical protein